MISDNAEKSVCQNPRHLYCKICKNEIKQIPIRKVDSFIILEEYCPFCDESIMRYEKILTIE